LSEFIFSLGASASRQYYFRPINVIWSHNSTNRLLTAWRWPCRGSYKWNLPVVKCFSKLIKHVSLTAYTLIIVKFS